MTIHVTAKTMIRSATQEDINNVEESLRVGDLAECEIVGSRDQWHQNISDFEQCWAVFIQDHLVGYCGIMIHPGETALSRNRWICFLSTTEADQMKITFVKDSRAVLKAIVERTLSHVDTFLTAPSAEYAGSVIWHERVLKMHRTSSFLYNNHEHYVYQIDRKEII